MVNVFKPNFIEESNDFLKHLPHASLISVDEEMTGIMLPPKTGCGKPSKEDSPSDRYAALKQVPERYSIMQLGICLFMKKDAAPPSSHATASPAQGDAASESSGSYDPAGDSGAARPTSTSNVHDHTHYNVRRYNFTLFPPTDNWLTREVTMNPSSIRFLQDHGLKLDTWAEKGVPFVTGNVAKELIGKYFDKESKLLKEEQDQENGSGAKQPSAPTQRKPVKLSAPEDKTFHSLAMAGLREWIDMAIVPRADDPEGASYSLPPCNSYLRRALYESINQEYPNLVLETISSRQQIRVWRLSKEEKKLRQERLRREGWEKLFVETVGMWRVFCALSLACRGELTVPDDTSALYEQATSLEEHVALSCNVQEALKYKPAGEESKVPVKKPGRKIPLIVHNGLQDLMFLMSHFHSTTLPEKWSDCKKLIHGYFPVVYDTKTMSVEHQIRQSNQPHHTYLSAVYERAITNQPQWQHAFHLQNNSTVEASADADGVEQQAANQQEHEASYDAYMTGAAFCALACTLQEQYNFPPLYNAQGSQTGKRVEIWNLDPEDDEVKWVYGRNKLYFHLSPFTIDLECWDAADPLGRDMCKSAVFRISDIDPSVSTRHITSALSNLADSGGDRINYEIVWVDDTTFLVAVTIPHCQDLNRFEEQGGMLHRALLHRFHKAKIVPFIGFRKHLTELAREKNEQEETAQHNMDDGDDAAVPPSDDSGSMWSRVLGLWNIIGSKRSVDATDAEPVNNKKRRVD